MSRVELEVAMMWPRLVASRLLLVLLVCLFAQPLRAQPSGVLSVDDFVRDWQISKRFTLAVAQAMPASSYDFKATAEEMTFAEQMMHLTSSLFVTFYRISGVRPIYDALPKNVSKEVVLDWIDTSFDYVIQVLPKLTDKQLSETTFPVNFEGRPGPDINGRDMLMNMFIHVAHHRAQCEVYLRLKGIMPPVYTF
jgi:uncharacterized damage-inducible protein DinB